MDSMLVRASRKIKALSEAWYKPIKIAHILWGSVTMATASAKTVVEFVKKPSEGGTMSEVLNFFPYIAWILGLVWLILSIRESIRLRPKVAIADAATARPFASVIAPYLDGPIVLDGKGKAVLRVGVRSYSEVRQKAYNLVVSVNIGINPESLHIEREMPNPVDVPPFGSDNLGAVEFNLEPDQLLAVREFLANRTPKIGVLVPVSIQIDRYRLGVGEKHTSSPTVMGFGDLRYEGPLP